MMKLSHSQTAILRGTNLPIFFLIPIIPTPAWCPSLTERHANLETGSPAIMRTMDGVTEV
jgi:hypothetical protein